MICKKHPRYSAARKPRTKCKACEFLYLNATAERERSPIVRGMFRLAAKLLTKGGVLTARRVPRGKSKPGISSDE